MTSLRDLADQPFVSLTTFRKSGAPVATPLWIVAHADGVAFWTPTKTGKVKRLRRSGAVELRPCSRRGNVADDAPVVSGEARLSDDPRDLREVEAALRAKYGLQYRFVRLVEKLRPSLGERVVVSVTSR